MSEEQLTASEPKFKQGDKVWSMLHGWGVVVSAETCVMVKFSKDNFHTFNFDGTDNEDDRMPVLFHEEYRLVKEQDWDDMYKHCNDLMDTLESMEHRAKGAEEQAAALLEINKNLSAALASKPAGLPATSWYCVYPVEGPVNVANQSNQ